MHLALAATGNGLQQRRLPQGPPAPWPTRRGCVRSPAASRQVLRHARGRKKAAGEELDEEQLVAAEAEAAAAASDGEDPWADEEEEEELDEEEFDGRPPEILEEFSNFTPDPPGHKAGFVAIIGRPNAGKSTLMNALLGQPLSIVTPKAQTTRHRILGILSEPGFQAVFLDTPGIITDKRNRLEEKMMAAVQQAVKDADCLLAIVDASYQPEAALAMIQPGDDWKGPPMAVLLNKVDLLEPEALSSLADWYRQYCKAEVVLPISAREGQGLRPVSEWLESKLPEGPSLYPKDIVSELPERFFASEIIRKHVFLQYGQEVPYNVAVEVTNYKERQKGKGKDLVEAEIVLDRERHRAIIIGRQGSALKQLGTAARAEIEEFLGRPVFLSLSVKVREGWRKDDAQLKRLGY